MVNSSGEDVSISQKSIVLNEDLIKEIDKVLIFDLNGSLVKAVNQLSTYIPISNLQTGIYVVQLWFKNSKSIETFKIYKK